MSDDPYGVAKAFAAARVKHQVSAGPSRSELEEHNALLRAAKAHDEQEIKRLQDTLASRDAQLAALMRSVERSNNAPVAEWQSSWVVLTGYVSSAVDDGNPIDAKDMLAFMVQLKREALAPIKAWLATLGKDAENGR